MEKCKILENRKNKKKRKLHYKNSKMKKKTSMLYFASVSDRTAAAGYAAI